jgi:hypothetical protein
MKSSTYHRFGSLIPVQDKEDSFFEGIDVSLMGIATLAKSGNADFLRPGLKQLNAVVESATADFSIAQPEKIAPKLAEGWKQTEQLILQVKASQLSDEDKYNITFELEIKKTKFNNAIAQALGISLAEFWRQKLSRIRDLPCSWVIGNGEPLFRPEIRESACREPSRSSGHIARNQNSSYGWKGLGDQEFQQRRWRPLQK